MITRPFLLLWLAIVLLVFPWQLSAQGKASRIHADEDGLALTPPMGWYPWNEFGQEPQNEALIKQRHRELVYVSRMVGGVVETRYQAGRGGLPFEPVDCFKAKRPVVVPARTLLSQLL